MYEAMTIEQALKEYAWLVRYHARKRMNLGLDYDDLYQEGCIGLVYAYNKFDASMNTDFNVYATFYVKGYILYAIQSKGRLVRVPGSKHQAYIKAVRDHGAQSEAASDAYDVLRPIKTFSTETTNSDGTTQCASMLMDNIISDDSTNKEVEQNNVKECITELLKAAAPREADLIRLYYGVDGVDHPHTEQEISDILPEHISCTRIGQITSNGIKKIRNRLGTRKLHDYV